MKAMVITQLDIRKDVQKLLRLVEKLARKVSVSEAAGQVETTEWDLPCNSPQELDEKLADKKCRREFVITDNKMNLRWKLCY